jgi:uncharacterized membrane protein YesL
VWEDRFPRLWPFLERASILVLGTMLFILFSLPVITLPAALCGLYRVVRPLTGGWSSGDLVSNFWAGLRENWLQGTLAGLISLFVTTSASLWVWMMWQQPDFLSRVIAWFFVWVTFYLLMVNVYLWPLLAWYPQPALKAIKRAAMLAIAHPVWGSLGVIGPLAVVIVPLFLGTALSWVVPVLVLVGPAAMVTVSGAAAWRAMRRYAPEEGFATGPDPFEEEPPEERGA